MSILESFYDSFLESDNAFDIMSQKADIFIESSSQEYDLNIKEANLKVMQENGEPSDLVYLEEAAQESLISRAVKVIKSLWDKLKKFISDTIDKVRTFFTQKEVDKAIKQLENAAKAHPELRDLKVEMIDPKSLEREFEKDIAVLDRLSAKAETGNFSSSDEKELKKVEEDLADSGAKIKKRVGIGLVSLSAAIASIAISKKIITSKKAPKVSGTSESDFKKAKDKKVIDFKTLLAKTNINAVHVQIKMAVWGLNENFKRLKAAVFEKLKEKRNVNESSSDERIRNIFASIYTEKKCDDDDEECDDDESKDSDDSDDDDDSEDKDSKKKSSKKSKDDDDDSDNSDDDDEKDSEDSDDDNDSDDDDDSEDKDSKKKSSKKSKDDDDSDDPEDGEDVKESTDFFAAGDIDSEINRFLAESYDDEGSDDVLENFFAEDANETDDTDFFNEDSEESDISADELFKSMNPLF